jgi:H+-transporting ATPase
LGLVFGNQALLYVVRERGRLWDSRPSIWVLASSNLDVTIVAVLALSGLLRAPLSWGLLLGAGASAAGFALLLDQIKRPVLAVSRM